MQPAPFFCCEVDPLEESDERDVETEALVRSVRTSFEKYVKLNTQDPARAAQLAGADPERPSRLADTVAAHLSLKLEDRQRVLEIESPPSASKRLYGLLQGEIEVLEVEGKIRTRVKKQMERSQKEYYLNEQMQAIQKELRRARRVQERDPGARGRAREEEAPEGGAWRAPRRRSGSSR